jgi:hypothetical protein
MGSFVKWFRRLFRRKTPDVALVVRDAVDVDVLFPPVTGKPDLSELWDRVEGAVSMVHLAVGGAKARVAETVLSVLVMDAEVHGRARGMRGRDICTRIEMRPAIVYEVLKLLHHEGYVNRVDRAVHGPFHGDRSDLGNYWYSVRRAYDSQVNARRDYRPYSDLRGVHRRGASGGRSLSRL